jgi:hypothetical protein
MAGLPNGHLANGERSGLTGAYAFDTAFGLAVFVQSCVVLSAIYLPYCDAINHLARWVMLSRYFAGDPTAGVVLQPRLSNYLVVDLLGAALVRLGGELFAYKLMAVLLAVLPGIGLYALLASTRPALRGWAMVGLLLGINRYYLTGYLNYQFALGLIFLWLAMYWRVKRAPSPSSVAGLVIFGLLASQVHLSSIAVLSIVVGCDALCDAVTIQRRGRPADAIRAFALPLAALGLPFIVAAMTPSGSTGAEDISPYLWRSPLKKVVQVVGPFYSLSWFESAVQLIGYLGCVTVYVGVSCRPGRWNRHLIAVVLLLVCFAVFPVSIHGTYDVDVRFLLPAYLLLFISRNRTDRRTSYSRFELVVPLVACLAHCSAVAVESRMIDRELSSYYAILQELPAEKTILDVVVRKPHFGVPIYKHFAKWYVIGQRGRVPELFGSPQSPFFEHFRLTNPVPYEPDLGWLARQQTKVDAKRLRETYDYILLVGEDKDTEAELAKAANIAKHTGQINLLSVQKLK